MHITHHQDQLDCLFLFYKPNLSFMLCLYIFSKSFVVISSKAILSITNLREEDTQCDLSRGMYPFSNATLWLSLPDILSPSCSPGEFQFIFSNPYFIITSFVICFLTELLHPLCQYFFVVFFHTALHLYVYRYVSSTSLLLHEGRTSAQ